MQDFIKPKGNLVIRLFDKDDNLKQMVEVPNIVVTTGKFFIAERMTGTPTAMSHMAIGSSNLNLVDANTTLESEEARVAFDSASTSNATTTYVATFGAGVGTASITEAGIFNGSDPVGDAGTMLCRTTFAVITKEATDTLTISWNVTIN